MLWLISWVNKIENKNNNNNNDNNNVLQLMMS